MWDPLVGKNNPVTKKETVSRNFYSSTKFGDIQFTIFSMKGKGKQNKQRHKKPKKSGEKKNKET